MNIAYLTSEWCKFVLSICCDDSPELKVPIKHAFVRGEPFAYCMPCRQDLQFTVAKIKKECLV